MAKKPTLSEAQFRQYHDLVARYVWEYFLAGKCYITLPPDFLRVEVEHGVYTQVQFQTMHIKSPAPFIRKTEHRAALKVFIPADAIAGDKIYIQRMSRSGLSFIGKFVNLLEQIGIRSCDIVASQHMDDLLASDASAGQRDRLFAMFNNDTASLARERIAKYNTARGVAAGISPDNQVSGVADNANLAH